MAFYAINKDGKKYKIAGSGGGGLAEIPLATENTLGGLKSSSNKGYLNVDITTETAFINDNVIMEQSAEIIPLEDFGDGPYKLLFDSDEETIDVDIKKMQSDISTNTTNIQTNTTNIAENVLRIQQLSNTNILDNWFFGNPVNQLGQKVYYRTAPIYTIDRWKFNDGTTNDTCTLVDGGIELKNVGTGPTGWPGISNMITVGKFIFPGVTYTYSAILEVTNIGNPNGIATIPAFIYNQTKTEFLGRIDATFRVANKKELITYTATVPSTWEYGDVCRVVMAGGYYTDTTVKYYAAKLEVGTQQTLAHQDSNGNWVLNDTPNYDLELLKCRRYMVYGDFIVPYYCTTNTIYYCFFNTPTKMYATPTIIGTPVARKVNGNASVTFSITQKSLTNNGIILGITGVTEPVYLLGNNWGLDANI